MRYSESLSKDTKGLLIQRKVLHLLIYIAVMDRDTELIVFNFRSFNFFGAVDK